MNDGQWEPLPDPERNPMLDAVAKVFAVIDASPALAGVDRESVLAALIPNLEGVSIDREEPVSVGHERGIQSLKGRVWIVVDLADEPEAGLSVGCSCEWCAPHEQIAVKCGALTKAGKPCPLPVAPGARCRHHEGKPRAIPPAGHVGVRLPGGGVRWVEPPVERQDLEASP